MPKGHNAKGRSKGEARHVRLYHWIMESEAWRTLKPVERSVWLEVAKRYNGTNNGYIAISMREIEKGCNIGKATACRAIKRLLALGFLEIGQASSFDWKKKLATEYRLTHVACDRTNALASKAFMRWRKPDEKTKAGSISDRDGFSGGTVVPLKRAI